MTTRIIIENSSAQVYTQKWRDAISTIDQVLRGAVAPFIDDAHHDYDNYDHDDPGLVRHSSNDVLITAAGEFRTEQWHVDLYQPGDMIWGLTVFAQQDHASPTSASSRLMTVSVELVEGGDPDEVDWDAAENRWVTHIEVSLDHSQSQVDSMVDSMLTKLLLDADLEEA